MRDLSRREGVLRGLTQHWRAGAVSGRMGPSACSAIVRTADKPPYTLGSMQVTMGPAVFQIESILKQ